MTRLPIAAAPPSPSAQRRAETMPLDGTRAHMIHRLQVGIGGILAIVVLVGLASIIETRLRENEAAAVPQAAPTDAPAPEPTAADPLVDAGIVPDLPVPTPSAAPPATGDAETQTEPGDAP